MERRERTSRSTPRSSPKSDRDPSRRAGRAPWYGRYVAVGGAASQEGGQEFKALFERCLHEAGLTTHTLHVGLGREAHQDVPENTIDSWRRPHSTTGQPSLPREPVVRVVAGWLCGREGVSATGEDLLAAWRADRTARATAAGSGFRRDPSDLRSVDAYPHNLPLQLTRFVGRVEELEKLRLALASNRLCTLTGTGGSGKTRLALEAAAVLVEHHASGVWWVDLAATSSADEVVHAMATALNVREGGTGTYAAKARRQRRPLSDRVTDHLRDSQALLVLDNCEHVAAQCAPMVDALLRECPRVRVLCTSREPLGIEGELVHRVPPLALGPRGHALSDDQIAGYESVQLFVDRAARRRGDSAVAASELPAVMEICRRVEGLPLAIELAAARVRMLSPRQILELLADRFDLLSSDSRTAAARHQTLTAMIDWSHDDLSPGQQLLLRRLSVFVGGFDLPAAQHVCSGDGLERFEVLDLLGGLIDKSLVESEQPGDAVRYRLLETIRAYALEKLARSGEAPQLRERHRQWYLALAEDAEPALTGAEQLRWLDRLESEHDNLRAALLEAANTDAEAALRLAAALGHLWLVRGFLTEGRGHLEGALAAAEPRRTVLRAKALAVAANLAMFDADVDTAGEHAQRALELSAGLGYRRGEAWARRTLGRVAGARERLGEARTLQEEALAISRELSDDWGTGFSLSNVGNLDALSGRLSQAEERYEESLRIRRAIGDAWGQVWSLFRLGVLRTGQGRFDGAQRLFDEALELCGQLRYEGGAVLTLLGRADASHLGGDQVAAEASYTEALSRARDLEDQTGIGLSVVGLANVATLCGDHATAERWIHSRDARHALHTASTHAAWLRARARLAHAAGERRAVDLHREALRLWERLGDVRAVTEELEDLATMFFACGRRELAARLLATAASSRVAMGAPVPPIYQKELEAVRTRLARDPSGGGAAPHLDEAAALALAADEDGPSVSER